jgi:enoyl-CoA hydratase/carnithine racemase
VDPKARVVVIAGAGPAFCAGHDLREMRTDPRRETYERLFAQCSELMLAIVRLPNNRLPDQYWNHPNYAIFSHP